MTLANGEELIADHVVSALPAPTLASAIQGVDKELARQMNEIPHNRCQFFELFYFIDGCQQSIVAVNAVFRGDQIPQPGYLWANSQNFTIPFQKSSSKTCLSQFRVSCTYDRTKQ